MVGDPVLRTGKPLSVELGPGKIIIELYVVVTAQGASNRLDG